MKKIASARSPGRISRSPGEAERGRNSSSSSSCLRIEVGEDREGLDQLLDLLAALGLPGLAAAVQLAGGLHRR